MADEPEARWLSVEARYSWSVGNGPIETVIPVTLAPSHELREPGDVADAGLMSELAEVLDAWLVANAPPRGAFSFTFRWWRIAERPAGEFTYP